MTAGSTIHFGVLCPPTFSHAAGMISLARQLQSRGHQVTFFNIPDLEQRVTGQGLDFSPIGVMDHPIGSLEIFVRKMGEMKGLAALRFGIEMAVSETRMILRDAPSAMRGISALLVDQGEPAGSSVAEHLGVPFATVCNAIPANYDPTIPPSVTPWDCGGSPLIRLRNRLAYEAEAFVLRPLLKSINESRAAWGLNRLSRLQDTFSPLIQVSQITADFDFPNRKLPAHFHYIGLFEKESSQKIDFPFEKLSGRPLVYATLGTVQTGLSEAYLRIAEACDGLDIQLVISLGSKEREVPAGLRNFPGDPLVVPFAPQSALLERSALTICHGGINTVLESLRCGVPVVSIPIAVDQPATGVRLQRSGAGETIALNRLSAAHLRGVIERILRQPSYRERAQALGRSIVEAGGSGRAADLIVEAMRLRR